MGRPDSIFGQFRETAPCRDAQHRDGVCCALASQLGFLLGSLVVHLYMYVAVDTYVHRLRKRLQRLSLHLYSYNGTYRLSE